MLFDARRDDFNIHHVVVAWQQIVSDCKKATVAANHLHSYACGIFYVNRRKYIILCV